MENDPPGLFKPSDVDADVQRNSWCLRLMYRYCPPDISFDKAMFHTNLGNPNAGLSLFVSITHTYDQLSRTK
ncbi:hypothetical protein GOBAR_DD33515 [Gossypium barbadense]|nr:hypothetical protein GOBAR_DD33515 [Gossypium barbadense]